MLDIRLRKIFPNILQITQHLKRAWIPCSYSNLLGLPVREVIVFLVVHTGD